MAQGRRPRAWTGRDDDTDDITDRMRADNAFLLALQMMRRDLEIQS